MEAFLNKHYKTIIAFAVLVFLANYLFVFTGVYQNDDVAYMRLSHELATTNSFNFNSNHHFAHRWFIIFVTAILYKAFGVNDYSSSLLGLASVLVTLYIILKVLKNESKQIIVIATLLFLFNRGAVFYSHRCLADAPLMLFITLIIYIYYNATFIKKKHNIFGSCIIGILFFLCIITKESIVVTTPFWLFLIIIDVKNKRNKSLWLYSFTSFLLLVCLYLWSYKVQTGDAFFRLTILFKNNHFNICSYDELPIGATLERISYGLLDAFIHSSYMLLYLPAICCCIYKKQLIGINKNLQFIVNTFIVLFLSSNFMTITYKSYVPLCPDARHFIFLIPLAIILSANFLKAYFNNAKEYLWFVILFFIVAIRMYFLETTALRFLYFPICIIILTPLLLAKFKINNLTKTISILGFVGYYSLVSLQTFIKTPYPYYAHQKQMVDYLLQLKQPSIVYCNNAETLDNCDYMFRFDKRNITTNLLSIHTNAPDFTKHYYYYLINNNDDPFYINKSQKCFKNFSYIKKEGNVFLYALQSKEDWLKFIEFQNCVDAKNE